MKRIVPKQPDPALHSRGLTQRARILKARPLGTHWLPEAAPKKFGSLREQAGR